MRWWRETSFSFSTWLQLLLNYVDIICPCLLSVVEHHFHEDPSDSFCLLAQCHAHSRHLQVLVKWVKNLNISLLAKWDMNFLSWMLLPAVTRFVCAWWNIVYEYRVIRVFKKMLLLDLMFLFFFYFIIFLLFKYSCLHFTPTIPHHPSHPCFPPLILPHFGFVHVSFIHVPAKLSPFPTHYPLLSLLWLLSVCS